MTSTSSTSEAVSKRPLWRRAAAFLFRWTYRTVGTLTILFAVLALVSRTEFFRVWFRDTAIAVLNDALEAKLTVDDVFVDLFHGVVIEHPTLTTEGTTLFEADRVSVAYDLASVFVRVATINRIEITRPRIHLVRTLERGWNFEHIVKPPDKDRPASELPDGTLLILALKIADGHVTVDDRTAERWDSDVFDPRHLQVQDLQLHMSARANIARHDVAVAINGMSFTQVDGPLALKGLSMVAWARPQGLRIETLRIRTTRSDVTARLAMDNVDLFGEIEDSLLQRHPLYGDVQVREISGPELHYFLPDIDLGGSYAVNAKVEFSGDRLDVSDMALRFSDAWVYGDCTFTELDQDQPYLNVRLHNSVARYADVRERLAMVPLPDLPFLHRTTIDHVTMTGYPQDSLTFHVRGQDRPGRIDGMLKLFLNGPKLGYVVDMAISEGDLSAFTEDAEYATLLNGRVMMVGKGLTLQDMEGTTQVELDRSRLFGRPIRRFRSMIQADGQGILTIDTIYADITPFKYDTLVDEDELVYESESTGAQRLIGLAGTVNVVDSDHPAYDVRISTQAVNLAELFDDASLPDQLSFDAHAIGEGIELDSIVGSFKGTVTMLALADRALLPFDFNLRSERLVDQRSIHLDSDFGHIHVDGEYHPSTLIDAIALTTDVVVDVVRESLRHIITTESLRAVSTRKLPRFVAAMDIELMDASLINLFLDEIYVSGTSHIEAKIQSTKDDVEVDIDSLFVQDFMIEGEDVHLYADPSRASGAVTISNIHQDPHIEHLELRGKSDSVIVVNGTRLIWPTIDINQEQGRARVKASSGINTMFFNVVATMETREDDALISLDTAGFILDAEKKLEWILMEPATITIADGSYSSTKVMIQRPGAELITIAGRVSPEKFDNAVVEIRGFPLSHIPLFANVAKEHPVQLVSGVVSESRILVNGTWEAPEIDMDLAVQEVAYNRALIGDLTAQFRHRDRTITGMANVDRQTGKTAIDALKVKVTAFPFDAAFVDVQDRIVPDRIVDIDVKARKLALAAIEPFLPAVESVRGAADADFHVGGRTMDDILMTGRGSFKDARFLSSATNLVYSATGNVHFEKQTLFIDTLTVRNDLRDMKDGMAAGYGEVVFKGLEVDSIDFVIETPTSAGIQVLSMASQARSPKMYGDLIIRSGSEPIRLYGRLNTPRLTGDLVVRYSDIIFPKERSTTRIRKNTFTYHRDDPNDYHRVSIFDHVNPSTPMRKYDPSVLKDDEDTLEASDPHEEVTRAIKEVFQEKSEDFVDALEFDLNIYLRGRAFIKMILGPLELLIADLEQVDNHIPLKMTGRFGDDSFDMTGVVRVKEGASSYQFYKPFRTSGELNFNTGGLTNPSLNLKATYEDRRYRSDGTDDPYKVEMTITGTKEKPQIAFRYWLKNREQTGDSAKIAADALMLILVGRTQEELVQSGQGNLAGEINSALSAVATNALGDIVGGLPGIQSAQVDIGSDISDSRLTVSGQVFGDVTYRVSGQVSDFSGSSTFTVSLPLSILGDAEALRLLRADLSHTVNNSGNVTRQMRLWEVKIGARIQ